MPFSEDDKADCPVSLYGATKKANELMAHSYSKLYGFASTGLRFFTVYGPWGRPDMSPMLFASAIAKGEPIKVFNNGDMIRDFTYVDDIVEGTIRVIDHAPKAEECAHGVPAKVYNIGCSHPVKLMDFISEIERAYGKPAQKIFLPMQAVMSIRPTPTPPSLRQNSATSQARAFTKEFLGLWNGTRATLIR